MVSVELIKEPRFDPRSGQACIVRRLKSPGVAPK